MFGWTRFPTGRASRVHAPVRQILLAALLACLLPAFGAARANALEDLSGGAYQILAPGEAGSFSPNEFSTDQGKLYDALTPLTGPITTRTLEKDYLSEKFGVTGAVLRTETTGKPGLE